MKGTGCIEVYLISAVNHNSDTEVNRAERPSPAPGPSHALLNRLQRAHQTQQLGRAHTATHFCDKGPPLVYSTRGPISGFKTSSDILYTRDQKHGVSAVGLVVPCEKTMTLTQFCVVIMVRCPRKLKHVWKTMLFVGFSAKSVSSRSLQWWALLGWGKESIA